MDIDNSIRKIRLEKGMTLKNLSLKTGISAGYLSHLERGTRSNPSTYVMEAIAKALGKSVTQIFFINDRKQNK